MQQLKIEHKNTTKKDKREGKGRVLAISHNVYHLLNSDAVYYVESESGVDIYYFVKFKPDVLESWCSCKDNSTRDLKCKHLFAIEFAIKWGIIKDIDKLPTPAVADTAADQNPSDDIQIISTTATVTKRTKSYLEDDYDF
jgi:hypothetical protein